MEPILEIGALKKYYGKEPNLTRALWGTTEFIDENALQVNLTRLKKTMASLGMRQQLVSVRGVGYRLEVPHEA